MGCGFVFPLGDIGVFTNSCSLATNAIYTAVICLLLIPFNADQFKVSALSQTIRASVGDDVMLPCHLDPPTDATDITLEWSRADLNPRFVHVERDGRELADEKNGLYEGRTTLLKAELKRGDVSLFISTVNASDQAEYRCFIPSLGLESFIQLHIGATQRVFSLVGEDVVLPRLLKPLTDVSDLILEWSRADVSPVAYVYVYRHRSELVDQKNPAYARRTYLFGEELKHGNVSLRLNRVRLSDEGNYRCYIPSLGKESHIQLVVGSAPSPEILLVGKNEEADGVVLQCDSKGWYPQPELSWLDGGGQLLPAGPSEAVRGADGLYTVRRNVTVKKTHCNTFTCRVQQHNISQTREKDIRIPEELFSVNSGWTEGFSVGFVVGFLLSLLLSSAVALVVIRYHSDLLGVLGRRARSYGRTEASQQEDRPLENIQSISDARAADRL